MRLLVALIAGLILIPNYASAALQLNWVPQAGSGTTTTVGQTLVVDLVLKDLDPASNLYLYGVAKANISVSLTGGGRISAVVGSQTSGVQFSPSSSVTGNGTSQVTVQQFVGTVNQPGVGVGTGTAYLGTFTLTSSVAGQGGLSAALLTNSNADIQTFTSVNVKPGSTVGERFDIGTSSYAAYTQVYGTGGGLNIRFTAVPEPTSMATASLLGLAGAWYARRKSKRRTVAA